MTHWLFANLSQVEFAAWFEIAGICIVRLLYLPRMLRAGDLPAAVPIGARQAVLFCMILLALGSLSRGALVIFYGATNWPIEAFAIGAAATLLRFAAVYLYIRTITHESDGEWLWLCLFAAAAAFALGVTDR